MSFPVALFRLTYARNLPVVLIKIISKYFNTSGCETYHYTVEFFEKHINKVNWRGLSYNTNITCEFFEKHIDKVDWRYLSENPNISVKFFEKHLDKVDWRCLSYNTNIP